METDKRVKLVDKLNSQKIISIMTLFKSSN